MRCSVYSTRTSKDKSRKKYVIIGIRLIEHDNSISCLMQSRPRIEFVGGRKVEDEREVKMEKKKIEDAMTPGGRLTREANDSMLYVYDSFI